MQDFSRSSKVNIRLVTIDLLASFCKQSKGAYQEYLDDLLRIGMNLLNDENEQILNTAWDCVDTIIKVKYFTLESIVNREDELGLGSIGITKTFTHRSTSLTSSSIQ